MILYYNKKRTDISDHKNSKEKLKMIKKRRSFPTNESVKISYSKMWPEHIVRCGPNSKIICNG